MIPLTKRSKKDARRIRQMGAEASNAAQRKRKELKETLLALLEAGNTQEDICRALISGEFSPKVFEVIRDTIGEKPKEVQDVNMNANVNVMPSVKIDGKDFVPNIGEDVRGSADT